MIKTTEKQFQAANWHAMTRHFPCSAMIDAGWNSTQHHCLKGDRGRVWSIALQWRHIERDDVSNHQRLDGLLNRLLRRRSKKTSKLRVTGLCGGNSPVIGEFPSQRTSNAENVFIWWRHHGWVWSIATHGHTNHRINVTGDRHNVGHWRYFIRTQKNQTNSNEMFNNYGWFRMESCW